MMRRNFFAGSVALVVGLPLGWIVAMMMTPLLWRVEPILHVELAGHSGPSDWVFYVVWGIMISSIFALSRRFLFGSFSDRRSPK